MSRIIDHSGWNWVDTIIKTEALNIFRKLGEGVRHRLESVDLRCTASEHLRKVGGKEAAIGADVVDHWTIFSLQPGSAQFQLGLIGSRMVKGKIGEIASMADEIVADFASRDERRDPDGVQELSARTIVPRP